MTELNPDYFFEAKGITKRYDALVASDHIDFGIEKKEIITILGDNGAGKSTLMKLVMGAEAPDEGTFYLDGRRVAITSPQVAKQLGINMVYQNLAVFNEMTIADNIFAGGEIMNRFGILDNKAMKKKAEEVLFSIMGSETPPMDRLVKNLSGGQRQFVAIARALLLDVRLLILDEPTAALSVKGRDEVYKLMQNLRGKNDVSIIVIGHNIEEAFDTSDRFIVLSRGKKVADIVKSKTSIRDLTTTIVSGGLVTKSVQTS